MRKFKDRSNKLVEIAKILSKERPNPQSELNYKNDYELTVAVILSAQCTDARVNNITPVFFAHFPSFDTLAKASFDEVYQLIKSCSYPNNKTKHLIALAQEVVNKYSGKLPRNELELLNLPGIGRKTANVLLSILERKNVLAVDTHVFRVAHRLGLVEKAKTPLAVEKQLSNLAGDIPLYNLHHWLVLHGRYVCKARNPLCKQCSLTHLCNYYLKLSSSKHFQTKSSSYPLRRANK